MFWGLAVWKKLCVFVKVPSSLHAHLRSPRTLVTTKK